MNMEEKEKEKSPKYIAENEVPAEHYKYLAMFQAIPKGMALVLDSPEYNERRLRSALHHHQKRHNEFKDYSVLWRSNLKKIFIVNHGGREKK